MTPIEVEESMFGEYQRFEVISPTADGIISLEQLMGDKVEPRKDFVFSNIDFSKIEV